MSLIDLTDDSEYREKDSKHGVMTKRSTLKNAGNGLFADRDFKKGEVIIPYLGERLTAAEKKVRYPNNDARYLFQLNKNTFIDAADPSKSNLARYANHRKKPNAKLTSRGNITTLMPIKQGTEIFISYGRSFHL